MGQQERASTSQLSGRPRNSLELLLHLLPLPLLHPHHLEAHAKHGQNVVSSPPQTPRPIPCWKALLASCTMTPLPHAPAFFCSLVRRPVAVRSESAVDFSQVGINRTNFLARPGVHIDGNSKGTVHCDSCTVRSSTDSTLLHNKFEAVMTSLFSHSDNTTIAISSKP